MKKRKKMIRSDSQDGDFQGETRPIHFFPQRGGEKSLDAGIKGSVVADHG